MTQFFLGGAYTILIFFLAGITGYLIGKKEIEPVVNKIISKVVNRPKESGPVKMMTRERLDSMNPEQNAIRKVLE